MIGLILVTHGTLADEFVIAMEHVVGPQKQIATVCIGPRDDMEARRKEIAQAETWAHLAVAGEEIFIREQNGLSAWRLSPPAP